MKDYLYWHNLHVCFRPSQYGFLREILVGTNRDATFEPDVDLEELDGAKYECRNPSYPSYFGTGRGIKAEPAKAVVYELLVDWRHVRILNFRGPQFYIGKRPVTNRWVGFLTP